MSLRIDFHTHVFPQGLKNEVMEKMGLDLDLVRRRLRGLYQPLPITLHKAQPLLRHLPQTMRDSLDLVGGALTLPGLLLESTPADLDEALKVADIDRALVIAHPPHASNEFVLDACQNNPRFIPAVNIEEDVQDPVKKLDSYIERGAKCLKIHAAADGKGPETPHYLSLLERAQELDLPVIIHTGDIKNRLFYKNPKMGNAEIFRAWFKRFPKIRFVLAHMNFHEPEIAMDLAVEFERVYVDTSWQPVEVIGEAVRRIGSEKVLLGSDWPLVGRNIQVSAQRVRDAMNTQGITAGVADRILGQNAEILLGLREDGSDNRNSNQGGDSKTPPRKNRVSH